ncbi:MAG: hypothetical protein KME54_22315 [Tolypothrix brevis GSE-NOS-MK-07-07A]|nr:hypothetical protein [Tolypothrix brevis GSE-NOS-MK-07-07A]
MDNYIIALRCWLIIVSTDVPAVLVQTFRRNVSTTTDVPAERLYGTFCTDVPAERLYGTFCTDVPAERLYHAH